MARPSTLPVWATNTNFAGGPAIGTPTKTTPSTSAQQEGWEPAVEPGAQNMNWWQNLTYQWINWLAGGVLDGTWEFTSNVQIDGTLTVTGGVTFSGDVTLNGLKLNKTDYTIANAIVNNLDPDTGSLVGINYVRIIGGGASQSISGFANGVDGRILYVENDTTLDLPITYNDAGSTAGNRVLIVNGPVSIVVPYKGVVMMRYNGPLAAWVIASASFAYDTSSQEVMVIPASAAENANDLGGTTPYFTDVAGGVTYANSWNLNGVSPGLIVYPIRLPVDAVLRSWKLYIRKTAVGNASAKLWDSNDTTGAATQIGSTQTNSTTNPGYTSLKETGLSTIPAVGHSYFVTFEQASGAADTHWCLSLEIGYTRRFMSAPFIYSP